mgnify:CR=1 FL=1
MRHFSAAVPQRPAGRRRPTSVAAVVDRLGIRAVPNSAANHHGGRSRAQDHAQRFQVVNLIGQGAFGKAYLAVDKSRNRQVVLKKIRIDAPGPGGATAFDDFRKEVECLRRLRHRNIVGFVASEFQRPEATIVLEYAEDGDLEKYLKQLKARRAANRRATGVQEQRLLSWFRQMLSAVAYMHDHKFLHRDIKSANIFLCGGQLLHALSRI